MTENHGVPGSNPGPATPKSPANSGKRKSSGSAAQALFQRRVNSRIEKRSQYSAAVAESCMPPRGGCRWRGSCCYRSDLDRRNQGGVMAAEAGVEVHHFAPAYLLGLFDKVSGDLAD